MIVRTVVVTAPPEVAFAAFTERIGQWWPPGHKITGDRGARVVMEPRVGGRLYERATNGEERDHGQVRAWDPPRGLIYAFYLGGGADRPTEVAVRFEPVVEGTCVTVQHAPGALPAEIYETIAHRYRASWQRVLDAYTTYMSSRPESP